MRVLMCSFGVGCGLPATKPAQAGRRRRTGPRARLAGLGVGAGPRSLLRRAKGRVPIRGEIEQLVELAGSEGFGDRGFDLAEDQPAAVLTRDPMQRHEVSQRRRSRESHPRQIHDQLGPSPPKQMLLIPRSQVLNGGGVETQAVPEFRQHEPVHMMSLHRGLQHSTPAPDEGWLIQTPKKRPNEAILASPWAGHRESRRIRPSTETHPRNAFRKLARGEIIVTPRATRHQGRPRHHLDGLERAVQIRMGRAPRRAWSIAAAAALRWSISKHLGVSWMDRPRGPRLGWFPLPSRVQ